MQQYFKIHLERMTFRELCRHSNLVTAGFVYVLAKLRIVNLSTPALHTFPPFRELVVSENELSDEARIRLARATADFINLGYQTVSFQKLTNPLDPGNVDNGAVFLLHSNGESVGMVVYFKRSDNGVQVEQLMLCAFSLLASGRRIGVTNKNAYMNPIKPNEVKYIPTEHPRDLCEALQKRVHALRDRDPVHRIQDARDLERAYDQSQAQEIEDRIRRGLYEPVSPHDTSHSLS